MPRIRTNHVARMNESCHTREVRLTCTRTWCWMGHVTYMDDHVTYMDESCHMYEGVMSHVWISHVTHIKCSWCAHTNVVLWVISRIWMRHVTHMNQSRHTHEWVTSHTWSAADVHTHMILYASYHTHTITCDSFVCVWHGSFVCVTWCMHISRIQYHFYESYHIYACVMSHIRISHVTHIRIGDHYWSSFWFSNKQHYLSLYEWVTSHTWSAVVMHRCTHAQYRNGLCHTYGRHCHMSHM